MARIELPGYRPGTDPKTTIGVAGLVFVEGVAESDDPAIVGYCQGAGYVVNGEQVNRVAFDPEQAEPLDPRDVEVEKVGTPLRDAAVDPRPGDNPPAGAGEGNPHGSTVVAGGPPVPPATPSPAKRAPRKAAKAAKAKAAEQGAGDGDQGGDEQPPAPGDEQPPAE